MAPIAPSHTKNSAGGVELELSALATERSQTGPPHSSDADGKRFAFLEDAPVESLVAYLTRERVQTIAVVLSYLAPARAADVLSALPSQLQVEAIERLAALGETDADSLGALETELAAWMSRRSPNRKRRGDAVAAILAAAGDQARDEIVANVEKHKSGLAGRISHNAPALDRTASKTPIANASAVAAERARHPRRAPAKRSVESHTVAIQATPVPPAARPAPVEIHFDFDDLLFLTTSELAAVLRNVDADVLVLALAGSSDELVDRIAREMPRRAAKEFRRQLRRFGPTRLSDVAAAQRAVAEAAARCCGARSSRAWAAMA